MTVSEKLYYAKLRLLLARASGKKGLEVYRECVAEQERYIMEQESKGAIFERPKPGEVLIAGDCTAEQKLENCDERKQAAKVTCLT